MWVWRASLLALVFGLVASSGLAQEPGTAARLGMGARPLALGGAFVAVPDDASSVFWNPAGLATVRAARLQLHYRHLSASQAMDAASIVFGPPRHGLVWGGSLCVVHRAGVAAEEVLGSFDGAPGANEIHAQLLVGIRSAAGFALGVGAGPLVSSLVDGAGRQVGWGGNAGVLWTQGRTAVGFGILGASGGLGTVRQPQPYRYRLSTGVSHRPLESLLLSVQLDRDRGAAASLLSGVEWSIRSVLALRGGIAQSWDSGNQTPVFSGGVGLHQGRLHLDYALRAARDVSPQHLLSLRFQLGSAIGEELGQDAADPVTVPAGAPQLPRGTSTAQPDAGAEAPGVSPTPSTSRTSPPTATPRPAPKPLPQASAPALSHRAAPEPAKRTLPVGLPERGGVAAQGASEDRRPALPGAAHGTLPDPSRVRYVVRAGVHDDMDQAALEIARFYRARIRPNLERRGDLYIVVIHRCDTPDEAAEWARQVREAGLQCTIDEE